MPRDGRSCKCFVQRSEARFGRRTASSSVGRESDTAELPAFIAMEKVPVAGGDVAARGGARAAAKDHLIHHELAVILRQRAGLRTVSGIRQIAAGGPLPHVAEHL